MIHVDPNHTNSDQPIPDDLTNIGSINNSADICAIEKTLLSSIHFVHTPYPVPAPLIFTYRTASDPLSPPHDSSSESMTPKLNPTPRNNPSNPVLNLPADMDSDTSSSYYYSSDSSDPSDDNLYK